MAFFGFFLHFFKCFKAFEIQNMMVMRQERLLFASSVGFTTPGNIVELYSSKNRFKKVQIPKIPPGHKEGHKFHFLQA